jgi:hypothetical protein
MVSNFAVECGAQVMINNRTTATLIKTTTALAAADSRIPSTSTVVTIATISTAGTLRTAPVVTK